MYGVLKWGVWGTVGVLWDTVYGYTQYMGCMGYLYRDIGYNEVLQDGVYMGCIGYSGESGDGYMDIPLYGVHICGVWCTVVV